MKRKGIVGCAIKIFKILVFVVSIVFMISMFFKFREAEEKSIRISEAEVIANYILDEIDDENLSTETVYHLNTDFRINNDYNPLTIKREDVREIIDSDSFSFSWAYALDENSVLISEGAIHQQVNGYIVTNENIEIGESIEVPEEFMYDGNTVTVTSEVKENVYAFSVGV